MEAQTKDQLLKITPGAFNQISQVMEAQDADNLFLRVYVQGGCGGIQYGMAIDSKAQQGDSQFDVDGMNVVVDRISLPYVEGVTVDFDTTDDNPGFRITHPNPEILEAAGGCGDGSCGTGGGSCGTGGCC